MMKNQLSVREAKITDFENIANYFLNADKEFLLGMGVDVSKLPSKEEWLKLLLHEFYQPIQNKALFYVIWLLNNRLVGHSSINKIILGEEAYMHLHMWEADKRKRGIGSDFVKLSIPYYFDNFQLKKLYCEPSSLNQAPNRTLKKLVLSLLTNISPFQVLSVFIKMLINGKPPAGECCSLEKPTGLFSFRLSYGLPTQIPHFHSENGFLLP